MLVESQLKVSRLCVQVDKANGLLACVRRNSMAYRTRAVVVPLYVALVRLPLKNCVQFLGPPLRDIELLERVQRRAMKLVKGQANKTSEEWLRQMGLFNL